MNESNETSDTQYYDKLLEAASLITDGIRDAILTQKQLNTELLTRLPKFSDNQVLAATNSYSATFKNYSEIIKKLDNIVKP